MKRGFLITILWSLFFGAFAAACTDNKEKDPEPDPIYPEWPQSETYEAIGGETVSFTIEPNMDWLLTLKNENGDFYWFVDGADHMLTLSGSEGVHTVKIGVSDENLGITAVGTVSISMNGETREIATITRQGLSGEFPELRESDVYGTEHYDYVLAPTINWKLELYTAGGDDGKEYFWIEGDNGEHLTELEGTPGARHIYIGHVDNDPEITVKGTLMLAFITDVDEDDNGALESRPILSLTLPGIATLFPEESQSIRKAAGETYEYEVEYPIEWTLTLSDTKTFYIEDGNNQAAKISGKGGEKKTVKFVSKNDSVSEGTATVSLTLGSQTKEVLKLTRPAIEGIPSKKEVEIAANEKYTLELNTDSPFDISIPASALPYFGIENGNTTYDPTVHYEKGAHSINIIARESTLSYDEDHECVVSMTMSNVTQEILVLKVKKLEREIKVYCDTFGEPGSAEFNDGRWLGQYTEAADSELKFKFNRYQGDFFALRIKVEASFNWSVKDYPEWILEESILSTNGQDKNVRTLEIDPTKLNLDGDSGEIVFIDASDSSNPVEVGRYTVSYPSARNECYGYIGYYDAGHVASDAFDKTGMHMTENGNEENASAVIVGTESAKAYIVGPDDSGKLVVSPSYSHIEYGEWDSTMPFQTRKFTYDLDANSGYNRTAYLYIFNGDAPADLISGDEVNAKYDADKLSVITQLGEKGREDGVKLYIVSFSFTDFDEDWNDVVIQCNEEEGLKRGIKYELLTEGSVAETVRKHTGVDDLEVWQVTYKNVHYSNPTTHMIMGIGYIASFTLSGYEGMAFEPRVDETLQSQLGITSPLKLEGASNISSTPSSFYIAIDPTNTSAKSENIVLLYTGEGAEEPLVALYIVYDPNAEF